MGIFKKRDETELATEIEELNKTVLNASMPEQVQQVALKEVERLSKTSPGADEYTIGINYIDYLVSLPWSKMTQDNLDIARAASILEEDHHGLTEIKERILEYLAVRTLRMSRKPKMLVVDDEKVTRMNLQRVLVKEGYEVFTASDGLEAIDLLDEKSFDVIITDLKMDKVDGMGVLTAARERDASTQVIMITGYATVSTAVEALEKGTFHYLSKPFRLDEIRTTVRQALSRKTHELRTQGPVLCFVGPPGTGKTSLGMSIASSLERKFVRISLAGLQDEAEIRGHRRSYVGALPGRIIQEIRRAGSNNPVFMLDELDKIGQNFKGDPAAALLEVLDPEQNSAFVDHYLDVPFDLSCIMFITTANTVDPIPRPLLDRLEVLYLSGYTEEEKENIAFNYLIPRAIKSAGLDSHPPSISPEAVRLIIREYTREAGLRDLQRQVDSICRKLARQLLSGKWEAGVSKITPEEVRGLLGPQKYFLEVANEKDRVGMATGLAWTESGGEIIFVEATKMKGKNRLILTGSLGEVMKESAQAALSYIRSNTGRYDISDDFFDKHDLHIHVPAGSIPKDGPSAGLAIAVALLSLLTNRPVRNAIALTGELTLSGRILPVGGVKEKVLAAHRGGAKTVIFPAQNNSDLENIPENIKKEMSIITIEHFDRAVDKVLA